jgi:polysaccharide export outer membrane protein
MMNKIPWLAFLLCLLACCAAAQTFEDSAAIDPSQNRAGQTNVKPDVYVLGPDDALRISVLEAPESSTERILIDSEGQITLPMTGRFQAAGLPVRDLEDEVRRRFTAYIHEPHVSVSLVAPRAQTVSVIGAVGKPGVHSIRGPTSLVEVLSLAGGLREDAGHRIKVSRTTAGAAPPFVEGSDNSSVAEVDVKAIMEASDPAQSIMVLPHDVVSVPRAEMVYVIGAVERSGGFVLEEREQISVIQALALAGGTTGIAAPKKARILRASGREGEKLEIPIDLTLLLEGRGQDVGLLREDILFVPKSGAKIAARQAVDAALRIGTGIAIFAGDGR